MNDRPEIDLDRTGYRQAFDRPLASPKHLRWTFWLALAMSLFCAGIAAWQNHLWFLPFCAIGPAIYAGAALAGLWPNFFFGNDASKDDFI